MEILLNVVCEECVGESGECIYIQSRLPLGEEGAGMALDGLGSNDVGRAPRIPYVLFTVTLILYILFTFVKFLPR